MSPIAFSRRRRARSSSPTRRATSNTPATWRPAPRPADLAVLLVDARKGSLPQTRRHACICSLLGIRHLVLAVNKMDLVDFDERRFDEIAAGFRRLRAGLGDALGAARSRSRRATATMSPSSRTACRGTRADPARSICETVEVGGRADAPAVPFSGAMGQPPDTPISAASPAPSRPARSRRATRSWSPARAASSTGQGDRDLRRRARPRRRRRRGDA